MKLVLNYGWVRSIDGNNVQYALMEFIHRLSILLILSTAGERESPRGLDQQTVPCWFLRQWTWQPICIDHGVTSPRWIWSNPFALLGRFLSPTLNEYSLSTGSYSRAIQVRRHAPPTSWRQQSLSTWIDSTASLQVCACADRRL